MATERPDGIDLLEDIPPEELTAEAAGERIGELLISTEEPSNKAHGSNRPSMDDALVQSAGSSFSPIQAVLKGSEEPLEYLVRSNLTAFEIRVLILSHSMRHFAIRGRFNPSMDDYLLLLMRRSEIGPNNAMTMAKEMYMGRQQASRELRQEGVLQRIQTIDQHTVEQNGTQR